MVFNSVVESYADGFLQRPGQDTGDTVGSFCVDFSYTTLFQLCENKMTFLLQKIKRNKNKHCLIHVNCVTISEI